MSASGKQSEGAARGQSLRPTEYRQAAIDLCAERDELRDVLLRSGFVRCDIAACNCGSWHHRFGLPERWQELKDALAEAGHPVDNSNGNLMHKALAQLVADRDRLSALLAEAVGALGRIADQEAAHVTDGKGTHSPDCAGCIAADALFRCKGQP